MAASSLQCRRGMSDLLYGENECMGEGSGERESERNGEALHGGYLPSEDEGVTGREGLRVVRTRCQEKGQSTVRRERNSRSWQRASLERADGLVPR